MSSTYEEVAWLTVSSCPITAFTMARIIWRATLSPNPKRVRQYLCPLIFTVWNGHNDLSTWICRYARRRSTMAAFGPCRRHSRMVWAHTSAFAVYAFVGQMHLECYCLSAVTMRICMFVSSRTNLHTCTLPLAGSRSPLVKYARGSHIGFSSTSQTRSCALRMPRYVTFTAMLKYDKFRLILMTCQPVWAYSMLRG